MGGKGGDEKKKQEFIPSCVIYNYAPTGSGHGG